MNARTPRLEEVASLAGVSTATVSRFLNNPAMVAQQTAQRVQAAIVETGYLPNLNAGALASNRSRLIAALVPDIAQSIFNDTMEAMIEQLSADGNSVVMSLTGPDNRRLEAQIDAALSRRVDAIILTGIVSDVETRKRLKSQSATVIETGACPRTPSMSRWAFPMPPWGGRWRVSCTAGAIAARIWWCRARVVRRRARPALPSTGWPMAANSPAFWRSTFPAISGRDGWPFAG
jgi:hypothetical protein